MKKEAFWKILALALLLINIGTLGFLLLDNRQKNGPEKPDKLIIEGLHLDEAQIAQFQLLKKAHRSGMDSLNQAEKEVRELIFKEIQKGIVNDSIQGKNLENLTAIRNQKDQITLLHFRELYDLCKENQKEYYHNTIEDIAKILMRGKPGRGK